MDSPLLMNTTDSSNILRRRLGKAKLKKFFPIHATRLEKYMVDAGLRTVTLTKSGA